MKFKKMKINILCFKVIAQRHIFHFQHKFKIIMVCNIRKHVVHFFIKGFKHNYAFIVHFKRLGSRHLVKEIKIRSILLRYNMIFRKTNLKPFLK